MTRRIDRILVVDVESTCWDGRPPAGQRNEIIEIGACVLKVKSSERFRIDPQPLYVRPSSSELSPFCTELTGIREAHLADAMPFGAACRLLLESYGSCNMVWASYGDYDRIMFEKQCEREGVEYPFGRSHINVRLLFSLFRGLNCEVSLPQAMDAMGLRLKGRHHSGADDAWNIAALLWELMARYPLRMNPWF